MRLFIANMDRHHSEETKRKLSEIMKRKHSLLPDRSHIEKTQRSTSEDKDRQARNKWTAYVR